MFRYLIVNHEQSNFSVSQSIFSEAAEQNLVPILSPSANLTINTQPSPPSKKLSTGAIAGIAIAVVILCVLALSTIFFIRRRRQSHDKDARSNDPTDQVELDGIHKPAEADNAAEWKAGLEMEGNNTPVGAVKGRRLAEIPGSEIGAEMEGSRGGVEMDDGARPAAIELDAGPIPVHEMPSPEPLTTTTTPAREDSIPGSRGTPLQRPEDSRGPSPRFPTPTRRSSPAVPKR